MPKSLERGALAARSTVYLLQIKRMSTRVASSLSSRRCKQELVRLLFAPKYAGKGPDAHRNLDPTIYSYSDLRKAYLERLQAIHPDKLKHQHDGSSKENNTEAHSRFVELQDAWDKYEEVAKLLQKVGKPEEATFTMFGVGGSFSDSPDERAMRDAITDQACRGWVSAGSLGDVASADSVVKNDCKSVPLCDDDWFVETTGEPEPSIDESLLPRQPRRSLIPPGHRFNR